MSDIARFYMGKTVVIFGASGFIGRGVLEKLLRSCPGLTAVYCPMQIKDGLSPTARLDNMKAHEPIFSALNRNCPDVWNKVRPIECDYEQDDLGISTEARNAMAETANIIIQAIGVVNFKNTLRKSAKQHVFSAVKVMNLIWTFPNLEALLYVSTLGIGFDQEDGQIREQLHPARMDQEQLDSLLKQLSDADIGEIGQTNIPGMKRITGHTTYYFMCKSIAENYLTKKCSARQIPLAIIRGPWVQNAAREPSPGIIDKDAKFFLSRIIIAIGEGVVRRIQADRDADMDWVPMDIMINTIVAAGWDCVSPEKFNEGKPTIFNVTSAHLHPCPKHILEDAIFSTFPAVMNKSEKTVFVKLADHHQSKTKSSKAQTRQDKLEDLAGMFIGMQNQPDSSKWGELMNRMSEKDQQEFWIDIREINWKTYARDVCEGLMKYHQQKQVSTWF